MKIHTRTVPAPHRVGVPATLFAFLLLASPCATGTDENPNPEPYPPTVHPPPTSPCNGPCESDCDSGSCGAESSCSEAGSVFFSLDLGRVGFERKTDLFRNAIVAGSNPALPSIAHRNRDFKSLNQFYRKSPLTGMRQFKLWIAAEKMTWPIYYRSAIKVDEETNAEIISDGGIRQILTYDRFVDIQSLEDVLIELEGFSEDIYDLITDYMPEGYVIRTWQAGTQGTKSGLYYDLPESDPMSWTIIYNPDEYLDEHRLAIIHMKVFDDSLAYKTVSYLHEDERDPWGNPVRWTLEKFDGLPTGNPVEVVDIEYDTYVNERKFTRVRTVSRAALDASGDLGSLGVIEKVYEQYDDIGGLSRLVEKIDAYGTAAARETLYGWHNTPTDTHTHGLPRYVVYPDGSYVHHTYSFNVAAKSGTVTRRTPWQNNTWTPSGTPPADSVCIKEVSTIENINDINQIVTVRSINTTTIARTTEIWSTESGDLVFTETRRYSRSNDLTTKTGYYPSTDDAHLANRIKWRELPDGTAETYEYTAPSGGLYLQTVKRGAGTRSGITAGIMVKSTRNTHGVTVIEETYEFGPFGSFQMESWSATQESVFGRIKKKTWINSHDYEETEYACCGIAWHRDRRGVKTDYHRDSLKRTWKTVRTEGSKVITTTTAHTFGTLANKPMLIEETHRGDGTTNLLVSKSWRNLAGETIQIHHPDQDGDTAAEPTEYEYDYPSGGGRVVSIKHPDNSTEITAYMSDGNIASRTGTAVNNTRYVHGFHTENGGGLWTRTIALDASGTDTPETVTSFHDPAGRIFRTQFNSMIANGSTNDSILHTYYGTGSGVPAGQRGQRSSTTDPDGVAISFTYDSQGRLFETIESMPVGTFTTRTTKREYTAADVSGVGYARITTTKVNNVVVSEDIHAGHGYISRTIHNQSRVTTTERSLPSNANAHTWHETTTHPDGTFTRNYFVEGRLAAATRWKSGSTPAASVPADITSVSTPGFIAGQSFTYDSLGRMLASTDSRTGTTSFTVNSSGQPVAHDASGAIPAYTESGNLLASRDPGGRATTYAYEKMGRQTLTDAPDTPDTSTTPHGTFANQTRTSYYLTGMVKAVWGDQTNATFHLYDEQNRKTGLRTYRSLAHNTEPTSATGGYDFTTWSYHTQRGWLAAKEYPDGQDAGTARDPGPSYTHTAAGRLRTRTWGGGKHTRYDYRQGFLVARRHFITAEDDNGTNAGNDVQTPDVGYSYTARGEVQSVVSSSSTVQPGNRQLYHYDAATFRVTRELQQFGPGITFTLDAASAAISISITSTSITRWLHRKADVFVRNTGADLRHSLSALSTLYIGTSLAYNSVDGRLHTVTGDFVGTTGAYAYAYQTNSNTDLPDTVTGPFHTVDNQWESTRDVLDYKENKVGTDIVSKYDYSVNAIGQRDSVVATSTVGTFGSAAPDWNWGYNVRGELVSSWHLNTAASSRHYTFDAIGNRNEHREGTHTPNGGTAKAYTPNALNQYDAVGSLNPVFDLDGNMTSGPLPAVPGANSALVWDGNNQLIEVTPSGGSAVQYHYDASGRRIARTAGGTRTYWFYDGWNVVGEFSGAVHTGGTAPAVTLEKTWLWGTDLSGSLQGAGGVGGLLAVNLETGVEAGVYHPLFDGNGNIGQYINSTGSAVPVAKYEYDGFGNTPIAGGTHAALFPHRFSTKPLDSESGLYYYGYRYYDPVTGRWPSRDPIEERGGMNLYGFVGNDGVNWADILGLKATVEKRDCQWLILFGHGSEEDQESEYERWLKTQPGGELPCGNKVGFTGCRRKDMNELLETKYPKSVLPDAELENNDQLWYDPAAPKRPGKWGPELDGYTQLKELWDESITSAKNELNKEPTCCKSITLKVKCFEWEIAGNFSKKRLTDDPNCSSIKVIKP